MVIARDPLRTWEYVTEEDQSLPPGEQVTWILGTITARQHAAVLDEVLVVDAEGEVSLKKSGTMELLMVAYGLRDVKGLKDSAGSEVKLEWTKGPGGPMVADTFLSRIPIRVRQELGQQIIRGNRLDGTDRKN